MYFFFVRVLPCLLTMVTFAAVTENKHSSSLTLTLGKLKKDSTMQLIRYQVLVLL